MEETFILSLNFMTENEILSGLNCLGGPRINKCF